MNAWQQRSIDEVIEDIDVDSYASISSSTMLVELSIGQYSGNIKDKEASAKLAEDNGAKKKVIRAIKSVFGECAELDAIQKCVSAARRDHEFHTVPWGNLGQRMLTTMKQPDYIAKMTDWEQQFFGLVENFGDVYDDLINNVVPQELGSLYKKEDYYPWDVIKKRYRFTLRQWSTPDVGNILTDLPKQALEDMKADMAEAMKENLVAANNNLWQRLAKVCENMSRRLDYSDKKQRFNSTLVSNVEDIVDLMRTLNVTNDPHMVKTVNRIEDALNGVTTEALREDEYMRGETKRKIDDVLASLPNLDI